MGSTIGGAPSGIEALTPQPGTSKRAPGHKIYPYLLRKLAHRDTNQVWALASDHHGLTQANRLLESRCGSVRASQEAEQVEPPFDNHRSARLTATGIWQHFGWGNT
jgi:hypothetical protein